MNEALSPAPLASEGYSVRQLPVQELDVYWDEMLVELRKIRHVWDSWWTEESLYSSIMCGGIQVWVVGDESRFHLVVFTQIRDYPANRIFIAMLMFGSGFLRAFPLLQATFEDYADKTGCTLAEIVGRRGWERVLRSLGFGKSQVVMVKRLERIGRH